MAIMRSSLTWDLQGAAWTAATFCQDWSRLQNKMAAGKPAKPQGMEAV
jgi:hypothetical protein